MNSSILPAGDRGILHSDSSAIIDGHVVGAEGFNQGSPYDKQKIRDTMSFEECVRLMRSLEEERLANLGGSSSADSTGANIVLRRDLGERDEHLNNANALVLRSVQAILAGEVAEQLIFSNPDDIERSFRHASSWQRIQELAKNYGIREENGGDYYMMLDDVRTIPVIQSLVTNIKEIMGDRFFRESENNRALMRLLWEPVLRGSKSLKDVSYRIKDFRKRNVPVESVVKFLLLSGKGSEQEIADYVNIYYYKA